MRRPTLLTVDPAKPDERALLPAAQALRRGGLVAFPTETVYGLGANAFDPDAVARVFAAKDRPADNPLIVHVADRAAAGKVAARMTPLAEELATRFWPGPLTLVLDAVADLPQRTTAGLSTVAVRVPDHPVALALLRVTDRPLAAPSANRSGRPSPTTAQHVLEDLGARVDVIIDGGPCRVGVESTVVDARGDAPIVLREGGVSREALGVGAAAPRGDQRASPGTRYRHYAPACAVQIAPPGEGGALAAALRRGGRRVGLVSRAPAPEGVLGIARFTSPGELALRLYGALRDAEAAGVDVLVVEAVDETGIGRAVMDRLRRAADG